MLFCGDDAILEDDVYGRKGDPRQKNDSEPGYCGLQCWAEGEKLNPAVAADVDLALGKRLMQPRPQALSERLRHVRVFLQGMPGTSPTRRHFTQFFWLHQDALLIRLWRQRALRPRGQALLPCAKPRE